MTIGKPIGNSVNNSVWVLKNDTYDVLPVCTSIRLLIWGSICDSVSVSVYDSIIQQDYGDR